MSAFYTRLANTANKLLASKGAPADVDRTTDVFDPVTGKVTVVSSVSQTLNAVLLEAGDRGYDVTLAENEVVGELKSAIASTVGSTFTPRPLDTLLTNNQLWQIFGVSVLAPSGTSVIYKLGLMFIKDVAPPNINFPYTFPFNLA